MSRIGRRMRRRLTIAGLGVVIAAAAVGGWLWLRPPGKTTTPGTPAADTAAKAPASGAVAKTADAAKPGKPPQKGETRLVADTQPLKPTRPTTAPAPATQPYRPPTTRPALNPPTTSAPASSPATSQATPVVEPPPPAPKPVAPPPAGSVALAAARRQVDAGEWLEARQQLKTLLGSKLSDADETEVRTLLGKVADETIFSKRTVASDPLVESYAVKSGDVLLNIGKKYDVPAEALMLINGISNPKTIRADQKLKVVRGPFNLKIYKSKFRMDIYLGDVYLRSYPVGLGAENGTPEGVWKVKERLEHPTYYPSASAPDKRIIPPDDPKNPLGERWIGLVGIEGQAVGHDGYGIHGTIEPDSIGKAVSLGCVRMRNEDVAEVYKLMMPGRSTVTILP